MNDDSKHSSNYMEVADFIGIHTFRITFLYTAKEVLRTSFKQIVF
jgi:hypothetical protein